MKRSGTKVMLRLIGLVKPLTGWMILAILMGLAGHLCASGITVLGGYAVLELLQVRVGIGLAAVFVGVSIFAVLRGLLRYGEQSCNHYIAFKLLALLRDQVFSGFAQAVPGKVGGKRSGRFDCRDYLRHRASGSVLCTHHLSDCYCDSIQLDFKPLYLLISSAVGRNCRSCISDSRSADSSFDFQDERSRWDAFSHEVR